MKKFTKKVKLASILLVLLITTGGRAQPLALAVNNGINYQCFNGGTNTATIGITSTPSTATSYSWTIANTPSCTATYTSAVSSNSLITMLFPCVGMYSICCVALNGSTAVGFQCSQFFIHPNPTITVNTSANTICLGATSTLSALGGNTYTWSAISTPTTVGFQLIVYPTATNCYSLIGASAQGCTGMATSCVTVQTTNILISPLSQTVCKGSSANLTASTSAVTYTWSTAATTGSINVLPSVTTSYTLSGTGSNGCTGTNFATVFVDSTCSNVWPGDANSDGVVNSSDVFEIGLAFNNTGSSRTPGGNTYSSQYANNWAGTVSSGKNKCHADCNGDGIVTLADTVAIYNNYLLTHSFKPSESPSTGDINLVKTQNFVFEGMWNKADIMLGSSTNLINQVYGITFDINFDNSLIQTNSAYIVYSNSFLNASNQNVEFRKLSFTNGKVYAASVRVDGSNVSGSGKIGEFWFFVKNTLPTNSILNLSVTNANRINKDGVTAPLTGGSSTLSVTELVDYVGIKKLTSFNEAIQLFPNPATDKIILQSSIKEEVNYSIYDIVGRELFKGEFVNSETIDLTTYSGGTYIIRFENGSATTYKKLVLEK